MKEMLDRHEYELLDSCAEGMWVLSRAFYRACTRGMDLTEASEVIERMIRLGLLFALRIETGRECREVNGAPDYTGRPVCFPTVKEIASSYTQPEPGLAIGLTQEGGAAWEALAHPRWGLYIRNWTREVDADDVCGPWEAQMWSRTRERLVEAIRVNWLGEPIGGTEEWQSLSPWRATYWKTLRHGWHVRFLTHGPDSDGAVSNATREESRLWTATTNWYRLPWRTR
jgi:hypothetical protein